MNNNICSDLRIDENNRNIGIFDGFGGLAFFYKIKKMENSSYRITNNSYFEFKKQI